MRPIVTQTSMQQPVSSPSSPFPALLTLPSSPDASTPLQRAWRRDQFLPHKSYETSPSALPYAYPPLGFEPPMRGGLSCYQPWFVQCSQPCARCGTGQKLHGAMKIIRARCNIGQILHCTELVPWYEFQLFYFWALQSSSRSPASRRISSLCSFIGDFINGSKTSKGDRSVRSHVFGSLIFFHSGPHRGQIRSLGAT